MNRHFVFPFVFALLLSSQIECKLEPKALKQSKHDIIRKVHKFSIGKDFSSAEIDEDSFYSQANSSLYSNMPPTLSSTTPVIAQQDSKQPKNSSSISSRPVPTSSKFVSLSSHRETYSTSSTYAQTTSTYTEPETSFSSRKTPSKTTKTISKYNKKLKELRKNLKLIAEKSGSSHALNQILDDVFTIQKIDYANLSKGRSMSDTRAVLNYMIRALHNIKLREHKNFDTLKFLDDIVLDVTQVSPDGLFESDIVLSKDQAYNIFSKYLNNSHNNNDKSSNGRKVIRNSFFRWPLPIHYHFDGSHSFLDKEVIRMGLKRWEENTCLEFKEITSTNTDVHYLKFIKGFGCWSPVGFSPDYQFQELSLGDGCVNKGTVMHEVGHSLGFFHEHSRPDRDDFVEIVRNNIAPFRELNFEKYSESEIVNFDIPYDLASDMHYGSLYFSANNDVTIRPKDRRYQKTIGQRGDLSFSDIKTANQVYCKNICQSKLPCQRGGYPNPKKCSECLCPHGFSGIYCDEVASSTGSCGGLIKNHTGLIQTPNYPLYYPGYVQCNWLIQAPPGYRIRLTFSKLFSTTCDIFAKHGPCDQDWLEIRDNSKFFYQGGPRYCCTQAPEVTESIDNEMVVLFRSNGINQDSSGFRAMYEIIKKDGSSINPDELTTTTRRVAIDYCAPGPCMNGAYCMSTQKGFVCNCQKDFTGTRCESKLSKCADVVCENNGICLENTGNCLCSTGFTGENCEVVLDSCLSNPCVKGVCVNLEDTSYKCFCLTNYTGARCEINLTYKHCKPDLCLNNGKCIESPLIEGFVCQCPKNYNGILCENSICSNEKCGPNGTCILKEEGGYYCQCEDGSTGENCRSHPCSTNICGDHGLCERKGSNYVCKCVQGYEGRNCENKGRACKSNPCLNGICIDQNGSFNCECYAGYFGETCEKQSLKANISSCLSNPCINNGICIDNEDGYACFCPPGFVGNNCEFSYKVETNICSFKSPCKYGECSPDGEGYKCACYPNWTGENCDLFDVCASSPCNNRGVCIPAKKEGYVCSCFEGYSGPNCQHVSETCSDEFCSNQGKCTLDQSNEKGFKCNCMPNHTGETCEFNLNSCASNPCPNDQICMNNEFSYVCVCIKGFSCQTPFSSLLSSLAPRNSARMIRKFVCTVDTCQNDGVCETNGEDDYVCKCKFGYTGKNCEKIDKCLLRDNICLNGGTCVMKGNKLACDCPPNFEPPYCQKPRVKSIYCDENVCKNGGTCIHTDMDKLIGMKCVCKSGYTGVFCETTNIEENIGSKIYDIPSVCKSFSNITNHTELDSLKIAKTPHSSSSYYLIQDNLIWFITGKENLNINQWPVKLSKIFPNMTSRIDAIVYDFTENNYIIFKSNRYWKFSSNIEDPSKPVQLLKGFPRKTKPDYGVKNIESAIFVNASESTLGEDNSFVLIFKDSKLLKYNKTRPLGIYFLPFDLTPIQSVINIDSSSFFVLHEHRVFNFEINYKSHQVALKSIDSNVLNSFFCEPFEKLIKSSKATESQSNHKVCPELSTINSIVKLNSTTGLMLRGEDQLEYVEINKHGYRLVDNTYKNMSLDLEKGYKNSMINLNRILFVFQTDIAWIYSFLNDTLIKNESPGLFQNLFPTHNTLSSIVSAHYSPETKKFYFFSDKFYIEYENQNRMQKKTSISNLTAKLTNVIQNHEDYNSVYLIDENNFVYYLNLKSDYLESVDRRTASIKLFVDCIYDS